MKCKKCRRKIPNKKHRTKYGCKWCDYYYHFNKDNKCTTFKDLVFFFQGEMNSIRGRCFQDEDIKKFKIKLKKLVKTL